MSTQNEKANQLIEAYQVKVKNSANLEKASEVNDLEISETVSDLVKQSAEVYKTCKDWKFKGQNIKILVFFHNGSSYTYLERKKYDGKVSTLADSVSKTIFNTFATLRGKGKMNIVMEIDGEKINLKTGRVYTMTRKNMKQGINALTVLQSYAYLAQ
jgi:hypothetical protein